MKKEKPTKKKEVEKEEVIVQRQVTKYLSKTRALTTLAYTPRDIALDFMAKAKEEYKKLYEMYFQEGVKNPGVTEEFLAKKAILNTYSLFKPLIQEFINFTRLHRWINIYYFE